MAPSKKSTEGTPEIKAVAAVYAALDGLDPPVQMRVLRYASEMLGLTLDLSSNGSNPSPNRNDSEKEDAPTTIAALPEVQADDDAEGISAVALKWMKRSGLSAKSLQSLFSLGVEDIDLVAKKVPGASKKERMRSVLLLKGIAAYLGTGAARVTYEELKEACLHYNAHDLGNFAAYLKSFAPEVSGSKESGYTLTGRGISSATDLVKEILSPK
jgi:hypothetical protein